MGGYVRSRSPTKLVPLQVSLPKFDELGYRIYEEGDPRNRFAVENSHKRVKANFNSDLVGVAADKIKKFEIASNASQDSITMSNGERVERLLRSVDNKRSTNELAKYNEVVQ